MEIDTLTPSSFKNGVPVAVSSKPPIRTRNRKPLSCIPCRQQKIKCNRERPCDSCIRYKRDCSYSLGSDRQTRRRSASKAQSTDNLKPNGYHQANNPTEDSVHNEPSALESTSSIPSSDFPPDQHLGQANHQSQNDRPRGNPIGYASYKDKHVKFKGPSHWASITGKFEELEPFIFGCSPAFQETSKRLKACKRFYSSRTKRNRNFPFLHRRHSNFNLPESIMSILPDRSLVESFINNYLSTFEMTHRLLHIPTFKKELEAFWAAPAEVCPSWLSQLMMMLALGCPRAKRVEDIEMVDGFLDAAEFYLSETSFMYKPNLVTLRAMCMMAIAKHIDIVAFDDSDGLWSFMGVIQRLAMSIGLHQDPSHFEDMPVLEMEMRKRLWTTFVCLDIQMTMESGMPMLLASPDFSCPIPRNFDDDDISISADLSSTSPLTKSVTESSHQQLLAKSLPLAIKINSLINSNEQPIDAKIILMLSNQVKATLKDSQNMFISAATQNPNCPWINHQRTATEVFFRRLLLALHREQSLAPNSISLHPESYFTSLECSYSLIILQRTFYEYSNTTTDNEWLAELFKADFLIAALYVSLGLWQNKLSDQYTFGVQMPERATAKIALDACLNIWGSKITISLDHFKTHYTLAMILAGIGSREANMDLLTAMERAAIATILTAEDAFSGIKLYSG
ncbi:fungal-specific transcription factor domain-containing protein [Cadophora sp. MPI-SDFR-AT-0126]|nr:fungal-specific transcription factor domain-containing protein [Leotiomycetes sp. MPI-SDFR-AT-0126]